MKPVQFLEDIGVDTRFLSISDGIIYINNLKFSKFSRKREDTFKKRFPDFMVVRSKIFQKICLRASRNLAHCIHPKKKVFLVKSSNYRDFALSVILEPYKRKYGIQIIYGDDMDDAKDLNADFIALPLTLDDEVENIVNMMLDGKMVELLSSKKEHHHIKLVYPLVNVPRSWICSWLQIEDTNCATTKNSMYSKALLEFLERFIPNVRENMLKSCLFVSKDFHDDNSFDL